MLKTGIYKTSQLDNPENFKNIFGRDKRISVTLHEKIAQRPDASELTERMLLMLTDDRGAYKRTYINRFAEFDSQVINYLEQAYQNRSFVLHDVGVSDGRTAVEFYEKLVGKFAVQYFASDYSSEVYVLEQGDTKITLSSNNNIVEILYPPFVFNKVRPDQYWYEPINRVVQLFIEIAIVPKILNEYRSGKIQPRAISLFCAAATELAKIDGRFCLRQQNILEPLLESTDVVRAMNILNTTYFTTRQFKIALQNIHNSLNTEGLLITGSNQDANSVVHGGIYQKTSRGFSRVYQSGDGSPIEQLILTFVA